MVGGGHNSSHGGSDVHGHIVKVWLLLKDCEEEVKTLQLEAVDECVAMCSRPAGTSSFEFAVGTQDGAVRVFDPESWTMTALLAAPREGSVWSLAFNSDGSQLAAGRNISHTVTVYDCGSAAVLKRNSYVYYLLYCLLVPAYYLFCLLSHVSIPC